MTATTALSVPVDANHRERSCHGGVGEEAQWPVVAIAVFTASVIMGLGYMGGRAMGLGEWWVRKGVGEGRRELPHQIFRRCPSATATVSDPCTVVFVMVG